MPGLGRDRPQKIQVVHAGVEQRILANRNGHAQLRKFKVIHGSFAVLFRLAQALEAAVADLTGAIAVRYRKEVKQARRASH